MALPLIQIDDTGDIIGYNKAAQRHLFQQTPVTVPSDASKWFQAVGTTLAPLRPPHEARKGNQGTHQTMTQLLSQWSNTCRQLEWGQTIKIGCRCADKAKDGWMAVEAVVEAVCPSQQAARGTPAAAWTITLVRPSVSRSDEAITRPSRPPPKVEPRVAGSTTINGIHEDEHQDSSSGSEIDDETRMPTALELYPILDDFTQRLENEQGINQVMEELTHLTTTDKAEAHAIEQPVLPLKQALRVNRNRLSSSEMLEILDKMAPMTFVSDAQGQLLWLSENYYTYTGTAVTCTTEDFVANYFHGDLHRVLPIYMNAVAQGQSYKFEYRLRHADGSFKWFLCEGNPCRDDDGNVTMYAGSITNVDELVQSRHEAVSVRKHVRDGLIGATIILLILDSDLNIAFFEGDVNLLYDMQNIGPVDDQVKATRISPGRDGSKTPLREVWPDERVLDKIMTAADVPDGEMIALTLEYGEGEHQKWSRYRIATTRGGPDVDDQNAVSGIVVVAGDVTAQMQADALLAKTVQDHAELQQSELAAQEASRLKTSFLQLLSHELRSPISGVVGICELLLDDQALAPAHRSLVSNCMRLGEVQLELVNAVLDLRKLEQQEMLLELESFELEQLIADARLYSLAAQQKGLTYTDEMEEGVYEATLLGDRLRLRQVLANALSNAIKFTSKGGVTLRVSQLSETAEQVVLLFQVEDTGIGISQHVMPALFQPFRQADPSTARKHGGTGLGLAISKSLVQLMGGKVSLTSVEGKGTTFRAEIPLRKAPLGHVGAPSYGPLINLGAVNGNGIISSQRQAKDSSCNNNLTDNEILRMIVIKLLNKMNFQVWSVSDGQEAIQAVRSRPYDVILMDCMMPQVDGYQATKAILQLDLDPQPKIIALTANAIIGDEEKCLAAGMHAYISKPVRAEHLEQTIWRVLEQGS
ncbi:hypothetical protein OIO90_004936 [Microbotryomycetes sp. JL221]|nr:hypothetical protein OIO90_004936 [Microbotryomycetes sp. JL221]